MKLSDSHTTDEGVMSDAIVLYTLLSMASDVSDLTFFIVIREVEVEIDAGVDRLPDVIPTLLMDLLNTTLTSLLASCASAGGLRGSGASSRSGIDDSLCTTIVTEPVTVRYLFKASTVCVPQLLTSIAVHQNVFIVILAAHLAGLVIILLLGNLEEHRGVKFGDLSSLLNGIGG